MSVAREWAAKIIGEMSNGDRAIRSAKQRRGDSHCAKVFAFAAICAVLLALAGCGVVTPHVVRTPNQPTIDFPTTSTTWPVGRTMFFKTDPVSCSQGNPVQYRWSWGDGTYSRTDDGTREWLFIESWFTTYQAPGVYEVRVMARCARDHSVTSAWSDPLVVTIVEDETPPPPAWREVGSWSGSSDRFTERFTISAGPGDWRIRWTARSTSEHRPDPWLWVRLYRVGEERSKSSEVYRDTSGVSYVHEGPGTYYLEIQPSVTSYTVIVEERR